MSIKPLDLSKTKKVLELFKVPKNTRDSAWVQAFYALLPEVAFYPHSSKKIIGPDGFRYMAVVFANEKNASKPGATIPQSISQFTEAGCKTGDGLVLCPEDIPSCPPVWVFTYGDLWSFHKYGSFWGDPQDINEGLNVRHEPVPTNSSNSIKLEANGGAGKAIPSLVEDEYFPLFARVILAKFFKHQKLNDVRYALKMETGQSPSRRIIFNIGVPPENKEAQGKEQTYKEEQLEPLATRLQWFFPRQRAFVVKSEPIQNVHLHPNDPSTAGTEASSISNWKKLAA